MNSPPFLQRYLNAVLFVESSDAKRPLAPDSAMLLDCAGSRATLPVMGDTVGSPAPRACDAASDPESWRQ